MVTRLKKWKSRIGFLAFVLGTSLLLLGVIGIGQELMTSYYNREPLSTIIGEDYQSSNSFRQYMSSKLETFISMACGEYLYGYGYDMDISYSEEVERVIEDSYFSSYEENGDYYNWEGGMDDWDRYTDEEKKKSAERYHDIMKGNKNLLYIISYDENVLYSNMDDMDWNLDKAILPSGYNFYLHFDGSKVTVQKDGKEIDIYGDGYYREEDWYVPGYKNFVSNEEWKKAEVIVLAAKEPVLYSGRDYGRGDRYWDSNELYYIYQNLKNARDTIEACAVEIVLGIIFMVCYFLLRKEKREVDNKIAAVTGKVWFEIKLLLLVVMPLFFMFLHVYKSNYFVELSYEFHWAYEEGYYNNYITQILDSVVTEILRHPYLLLFIFWCFALLINDLKKNKGSYKHGLMGKFINVIKLRDLRLTLSKRMVTRCYALILFGLLSAVVCIIFFTHILTEYVSWGALNRVEEFILFSIIIITVARVFLVYYYLKKNKKLAINLEDLGSRVTSIYNGNYTEAEKWKAEDSDLKKIADELDVIQQGMETAVEERTKSERMKVEFVANVSHDIKTPLTSIISYIQLLKQEDELPDYVMDYINILDEKSERLKNMVQDVFSVSKAASGQLPVELKKLDFGKLLYQTLADMDGQVKSSSFEIRADIPVTPVMVCADGQRMYRVFQNLIMNALKYSLKDSRIYVTLKEEGAFAVVSIKNTSCNELASGIDFTERFVRGDASRTDGGSGLGLSIAKSFTEACGGTMKIETIADLFVVTVTFPKAVSDVED